MANRHFGKLADVWKHLPLCEVLSYERPSLYAETHAGSSAYAPVHDAERGYGVHRFHSIAGSDPLLAHSRYAVHLARTLGDGLVPGSPLLAMRELGASARYVLSDMDPGSTEDIELWADRLDLADRVTTVRGDGLAAVATHMLEAPVSSALVHIDPYDPNAREQGSLSALELSARLITAGIGVMYWYGFDAPDQRSWALHALRDSTRAVLWCGDMLVTAADRAVCDEGDLGRATTPGTGFGVVLGNVSPAASDRCGLLGAAIARAYEGAPLPDGRVGTLDFVVTKCGG